MLGFAADDAATLLLLGARDGEPLPWRREPPAGVRAAVAALHHGPDRQAADHPWLTAARAGPPGEAWAAALSRRPWPLSYRHGDLLPHHILVDGGGTARLIDWEYGAAEGFPWVDLAHLLLHTAALLHRWSPPRAIAHATRTLTRRPWPALDADEANAILRMAAFAAHRGAARDGHPDDAPLQVWRRAVWTRAG